MGKGGRWRLRGGRRVSDDIVYSEIYLNLIQMIKKKDISMQQGRKKNPKYEEEIHMIYACNKEEKK